MHMRLRETYNFQLSAFTDLERKELAGYICGLKSQYLESTGYVAKASHIVCRQITRSEKYLCGCAAGKWILTKDYIIKSHKAGKWLNECDYEWGSSTLKKPSLSRTPRYWREYTEKTGRHPFTGWVIGVVIENQQRCAVYKRLLRTGGAKVINIDTAKAADQLTHILVETTYRQQVKHFAKAGVICVLPDYLAEVIQQESPNVEKFLVFDASLYSAGLNNNNNTISSDCSLSFRNPKCVCSASKTSVAVTRSSSAKGTTTLKMGGSATKSVCGSAVNSRSTTKISTCSETNSKCISTSKNSVPSTGRLSRRAARLKHEAQSPTKVPDLRCTPEKRASGIKRKLVFTEYDVREALKNLKRQKVETPSYSMVPCWMQVCPKQSYQQKTCAVPFYPLTCNIIEGAIEEGEWIDAVNQAQISISTYNYPPPRLLNIFMQELLVTSNELLPEVIYHLLKTCLCVHPPGDFPSLPAMYLESFCTERIVKKNWNSSRLYVCCDTPWEFVSHMISRVLGEARNDVAERGQSLLLLRYVVALFDQDFRAYCDRWKNKEVKKQGYEKSMVAKLLWPMGPVKPTAPHMRRLMCYLVQALLRAGGDPQDGGLHGDGFHDSGLQGDDLDGDESKCLGLLQALFGMAAECCRIAQVVQPDALSSGLSSEGLTADLVREMVSRLKQSDVLTKRRCLELYLDTLTVSWVKTLSVTTMLSFYDSSLVANSKMRTEKLSLAKIVKWYFYLLPEMSSTSRNTPKKETPTKTSPTGTRNKSEKFLKINKRNGKGETGLQVACIRGHLAKVKELLSEPSIDVNSQDNAGWSALHEACSKGHIACVRELLRFRPTKSIMHYFDNSKAQWNGLNLLVAPPCGTTPLHDAVANGRTEIALLLLQHPQGGKKLLTSVNKDGYTPLDYATADIKRALAAFDKENNNVVESPRTSFKEFQSSIPDEETYREVLGEPATHVESTKCATLAFLIQQLLTTYVTSNDLQSLKREVDFAHSRIRCNDDTVLPLVSNINGRISQTGPSARASEKQQELTGYLGRTKEQRVVDDLDVFSRIDEHLSNFEKHLVRISNDSGASLEMLLGLKWSVASQVIGEDA